MILTILRVGFVNRSPKIVECRDYSKFSYIEFRNALARNLAAQSTELMTYSSFESVVMQVLNDHAPLKKKYIRANDGPFMTKELRKAFMKRRSLKTVYNKNRNPVNHLAHKKQRNQARSSYWGRSGPGPPNNFQKVAFFSFIIYDVEN